jgi:hypothetical protein
MFGLDIGIVVVIAAVLLFYLRLILVQRQKAKRFRHRTVENKEKKKNAGAGSRQDYSILSIISARPIDRVVAAGGAVLIVLGIMLNVKIIPWGVGQTYWYIPVALGILAFSWLFR